MKQEDMNIWVPVGMSFLGRVIDADGKPCDEGLEILPEEYYPLEVTPPDASTCLPINRRFETGVRAIDSLLTMGKGQRMGIYSGPGAGKSSLLAMIVRNNNADINVICLIGERPHEAQYFIKRFLGEEALKRSVIVVANSDRPATSRIRAAYVCTSIAEYFRDKGMDVVLIMESVSRFADAQGEIELAKRDPHVYKGYSLSVFEMIPNLIYRSGTHDKGTITAFYTAHTGLYDDMDTVIINKMNDCLDGHIFLNRKLAIFPTIDILKSKNPISKMVTGRQTLKAVNIIHRYMEKYDENEPEINAGIYQKGTSSELDLAIEKHGEIEQFLQQEEESCSMAETLNMLSKLTGIEIPHEEYAEQINRHRLSKRKICRKSWGII